jgi:hypothetical protein
VLASLLPVSGGDIRPPPNANHQDRRNSLIPAIVCAVKPPKRRPRPGRPPVLGAAVKRRVDPEASCTSTTSPRRCKRLHRRVTDKAPTAAVARTSATGPDPVTARCPTARGEAGRDPTAGSQAALTRLKPGRDMVDDGHMPTQPDDIDPIESTLTELTCARKAIDDATRLAMTVDIVALAAVASKAIEEIQKRLAAQR